MHGQFCVGSPIIIDPLKLIADTTESGLLVHSEELVTMTSPCKCCSQHFCSIDVCKETKTEACLIACCHA